MMGLHHVEWSGPKLEGLTLDLGDLTPRPRELTVGYRRGFYSSVHEQVATDSRVDMAPGTDTFLYLRNALLTPLPAVTGSDSHYHVGVESRVDMVLERNVSVSPCSGVPGSGSHRVPLESSLERELGGHIPCLAAGTAGHEMNHMEGLSRVDSWMIEKHFPVPPLPWIARPVGSRGDLPHLNNVKVKIEKMEPVEAKPLSLPSRMSLPTDLTPIEDEDPESSLVSLPTDLLPREFEEVKFHPEPVAGPLTIDLSDTESEGSAPCLSIEPNRHESRKPHTEHTRTDVEDGGLVHSQNLERRIYEFMGSDQKCWGEQSSLPVSARASLPDPKSPQHVPPEYLKPKLEGVTLSDCMTAPSKPLKRKCSVIDLDSIIDLEEQELHSQDTVIPSGSPGQLTTRGILVNGSLVNKSESEENPFGSVALPLGKTASSSVPELSDRKQDLTLEQHGPITDSQVNSDQQTQDLAKENDQQYVFDIGHDMDDATMDELMCDDDEDLEPDFMLDGNVDVDQNFVVASFETDCGGLIPNSEDDQEEVPSWYLAQARRSEELIQRPISVNSQESNWGTGCSKGFQQGRGNAMQLLQGPSSSRELTLQLASSRQSLRQLVSEEGAQSPQLGQLQIVKAASNVSDFGVPLPRDTADAAEALRRFVQASSARGAFQPPQFDSASRTPQVTHFEGARSQHLGAQESGMDSFIPNLVNGNVIAENGETNMRPSGKNVLTPKSEPVELDAHRISSMDPVSPVKTEWPRSSVVAPCLDSRDAIINALKMFELGRMQMMQAQVSADPNAKRVRADLKVASSMRRNEMWQNEHRPIGECPGVKIGDCFTYRIEMAIIGLHRAVQAGIAVVSAHYSPHGKPVAGSVVIGVNDTYKDDKDMGETVIYSGQGGLAMDKSGIYQDQKLLRGNMALSNSLELGLPIRLIRGHKVHGTSTGILYSYDGLYKVTGMAYDVGVHKNMVYTFRLERLPGQLPMRPPSVADLLYPASLAPYPLPLNSHASLPTSSQVPQNQEQACIGQATSSQAGTTRPSTSQVPNYGGEGWTGQVSYSQTQSQEWTEEQEEKPLYLLPRSSEQ